MSDDPAPLDVYREVALERGRPTEPCECRACNCSLHTYPGDVGCVWCSHGQHADDDRLGKERQFAIVLAVVSVGIGLATGQHVVSVVGPLLGLAWYAVATWRFRADAEGGSA